MAGRVTRCAQADEPEVQLDDQGCQPAVPAPPKYHPTDIAMRRRASMAVAQSFDLSQYELHPSLAKLPFNILTAVKNVQNLHVLILDSIDNYILPDREATQAWA
jgi:hypothetical protein